MYNKYKALASLIPPGKRSLAVCQRFNLEAAKQSVDWPTGSLVELSLNDNPYQGMYIPGDIYRMICVDGLPLYAISEEIACREGKLLASLVSSSVRQGIEWRQIGTIAAYPESFRPPKNSTPVAYAPDIVKVKPISLLNPVEYKGKVYLTSQALHSQYREGGGEKYAELKNFNKAIRAMELFEDLLGTGDIVELVYAETRATPTGSELEPVILEADPKLGSAIVGAGSNSEPALNQLFKLTFGKPILLLSPVAQAELTHHLENEANKTLAMAANQQFVATNLPQGNLNLTNDPKLLPVLKELLEVQKQLIKLISGE